MDKAHQFALFYESLGAREGAIHIRDADPLFHRIVHVLRLVERDTIIFFNQECHVMATVNRIAAREILFTHPQPVANNVYTPTIICLLPLLRREAFDEAVYAVTECGASIIQPVITKKVQRAWGGSKEFDRLKRIIIAAAEQSKNYRMTELREPVSLQQALDYCADTQIVWCDPSGDRLGTILQTIQARPVLKLGVIVGPEGDFTEDEKNLLKAKQALSMALTPTILRAQQAMILAVGALRADLKK